MSTKKTVFTHVPYNTLLKRLGDVVGMRINPEIYFDGHSLDSAGKEEILEVREALTRASLECTVHGPFMELSPGAPDEKVRGITVERYLQTLDVVGPLKPKRVVLHASYDERHFDGDVALWLGQSKKTWEDVAVKAKAVGTVIALENVFEVDPVPIKSLLDGLSPSVIGACLDAGHLNIFSNAPMEQWFASLGNRIVETHIHDNHGDTDEHLAVGDGTIDFRLFFSLLGKHSANAILTIEPHGEEALKKGLLALEKYI